MSYPPLKTFAYTDYSVRVVEIDDQPWFVLKDVCEILGIQQTTRVAERLDEDEVSQIHITDSLGRKQESLIISESGLYAAILRSDKPEAEPFRKWVTAEVLPSIRKYGYYDHSAKPLEPKKAQGKPRVGRLVYSSRRCKVCMSVHSHTIDQMLTGDLVKQDGIIYAYAEIIEWAAQNGLRVSKAGLSRHRREHLIPQANNTLALPQSQTSGFEVALRQMVQEAVRDVLKEAVRKEIRFVDT